MKALELFQRAEQSFRSLQILTDMLPKEDFVIASRHGVSTGALPRLRVLVPGAWALMSFLPTATFL